MGQMYGASKNKISIGKESTWGGGAVPTDSILHTGFDENFEHEFTESKIKTGSRAKGGDIRVASQGKLKLPSEMTALDAGFFFKALLGSEAVSALGGGLHKHTFTMRDASDPVPFAFRTSKGGRKAFALKGAVCNSLSIEASPKAIVTLDAEFIYKTREDLGIPIDVATDIDPTPDEITLPGGYSLAVNDQVMVFPKAGGVLPTLLVQETIYFVKTVVGQVITLAATSGGAKLDLAGGSGDIEIVPQDVLTHTAYDVMTHNDGSVKIDGVTFGEMKGLSISLANNLNTEDRRLGGAGELASITAGGFDCTAKFDVVFNEDSEALRTALEAGSTVEVELTINDGEGNIVVITIAEGKLSGGADSNDDAGIMTSYDVKGQGTLGTPITIELTNTRATAY